jgi:hypothetical protein
MASDVVQKIINTSTICEGSAIISTNKLGGYETLSAADTDFRNRRGYEESRANMSGVELRLTDRIDNPTYYG